MTVVVRQPDPARGRAGAGALGAHRAIDEHGRVSPGASRPSVLYVCASPPVPSKIGPARRNFHVLHQLTRCFDVTLVSVGTDDDAGRGAAALGDRVRAMHFAPARRGARRRFLWKLWRTLIGRCDFAPAHEPAFAALCRDVATHGAFDAIVLSCVLLRELPLPDDACIVGDTHNVEHDVLRRTSVDADNWARRLHAAAQWRATRVAERDAVARVALVLATSERDRRVFERSFDACNVACVPNGLALTEFTPADGASEPGTILFSGLMSYYPNQQAARWFLDAVFPLVLRRVPQARVIVAGAAPPRWLLRRAGDRVTVTGSVPDMRPYIERAVVVVAPLLIGGGTRVKILEAQAMGRPVVSTAVGAEGLDVHDGHSVLLADEPQAFANRVADVLTDPALAARLAIGGRRFVAQHHDWDRIGEHLAALVRLQIARRRSSPDGVARAAGSSR